MKRDMAFSRIGALAVCLLFAVTNGHFVPGNQETCDDMKSEAGNDYLINAMHCQVFHRCSHGEMSNMTCGGDLLYDSTIKGCNYPSAAKCDQWDCNPTEIGTKYPHLCREKYYECTNMGYELKNCSSDSFFNVTSGNCMSGVGQDDPQCVRNNGTKSATQMCPHSPHLYGDECKYRTQTGNGTYEENMPCPAKTSFNATTCGCTNLNDFCPKSTVGTRSKMPDTLCRGSYSTKFDAFNNATGYPTISSQKEGGAYLDYVLKCEEVEFMNGEAHFSYEPASDENSMMYAYNFNNNEFTPHVGICVTFKANEPTTQPIHIVTNNYEDTCMPTVEITVTLVGNTYNVNATVIGMTRYSNTNETTVSGMLSGSLTVGPGSYIEACIFFNGFLNIKMTDRGADGMAKGTPVIINGDKALGTTIWPNMCGYLFGHHLNGVMKSINIYEGCRNPDIFYGI